MKKLKAVISIGSTSFPNLIDSILEPLTLESFIDLNIYQILLQFGHQVLNLQSHLIPHQQHHQVDSNHPERLIYDYHSKKHLNHQIEICLKAFVPDIDSELSKADLAIVHAGAGSILASLNPKTILIIIPNDTLMDSHQTELTEQITQLGYGIASTPSTLGSTLRALKSLDHYQEERKRYQIDLDGPKRFRSILDREMGFKST